MKTVLIVEDDSFLRESIRLALQKCDYKTLEAPDGNTARDIICVSPPDVILSDVQMANGNGIELLQWSQKHQPIPFILMTAFSHILETQKAEELGAQGFICKPFKISELLAELEKTLGLPIAIDDKPPAASHTDQDFCKLSICEFVSTKKLSFDIYVKLAANKFVKIGHKGSEIPTERIENYKQKNLKYLYVRSEDFRELVYFNLNLAKVVQQASQISREKKINFMKYTGEVVLEHTFIHGVDEESFEAARAFLGVSVEMLSGDDMCFNLLEHLNMHSTLLYAHSLGVAMYSVMIARKMEIHSMPVFFKLSLAGLYHDIGKKEIALEILDKPRVCLNYGERQIIETHTTRSKEILGTIKTIPSDVIRMVYEHHEDNIGQGFPQRLKKTEVHPLSKILATANIFAGYCIKGPNCLGLPGPGAIQYMKVQDNERLAPEPFAALKKIFKVNN